MKPTKKKEELDEVKILIKSAKKSSHKAQRVSKAMGLSIKTISANKLIEKAPDGTTRILKEIEHDDSDISLNLKKGVVLCRK